MNFIFDKVEPYMRRGGLLLGDFNCKSPWWGYKGTDSIGRALQSLVQGNKVSSRVRGVPFFFLD